MIAHVSIAVRDLDRAARFYQAVLGAIGYEKLVVRSRTVGFGKTYPEFWLNLRATMAPVDADSGGTSGARPCRRSTPIVAAMRRCACARANWSMRSMLQRLRLAAPPMARPACGRI